MIYVKKIITFLCAAMMMLELMPICTFADDDIAVYLDGDKVTFEDQQPVIIEERTLVPMRAVFEAMGAEVDWDGDYRRVTIYTPDKYIMLYIDEYTVVYGYSRGDYEDSLDLDVPPQIINERTMLPLRAVSEIMGATVNWDGAFRVVYIWSNQGGGETEQPLYDNTTKDDYYFESYSDISNFGWYIDENPYMSYEGEYFFDYWDYDGDIDSDIEDYIDQLEDDGFDLKDKYTKNGAEHYTFSGTGYEGDSYTIELVNDFLLKHIEIYIKENESSAVITPKPTATPTPEPTAAPTDTPTPTATPAPTRRYTYLKDMGIDIVRQDSVNSAISTTTKNGIKLSVALSAKNNPYLEKNEETALAVEYDLGGKFSVLDGTMKGSGSYLSLRFYCDDELVLTTPNIRGETNLDLDVSGCQTLRIEAYGNVGKYSTPYITINDARLWSE